MKTTYYQGRQSLFFFLALLICTMAHAQVLVPPTSTELNFGTAGSTPTCFNYDDIPFPTTFGKADIYLSAVNNKVYWQAFDPISGAFVIGGSIAYQSCLDMNVGLRFNGTTPQLVVAYYNAVAPGHRVDVYNWNAGGGSVTMAPSFPLALSNLSSYTRISMDTHIEPSGLSSYNAIVWENPIFGSSYGINLVSCIGGGSFVGGVISGTGGSKRPDVAFSHVTGGSLALHFVYHTGSGSVYTISETSAAFTSMYTPLPPTPTTQDGNTVSGIIGLLSCSIDCPDHHASPDIWTYVYSNNTASIFTRISSTGLAGTTANALATGAYSGLTTGMAITASDIRPRVSYNQSGNSLHVAFYSNLVATPITNNYYSLQINSAGTTLVSAHDYERVAAAVAPGGAPASIALSKQNTNNKYLYTVFSTSSGLAHKFHPWATTSSYRATGIESQSIANAANDVLAGPNPFAESIRLYVPESLKNETMTASLTDLSGKLLLNYNGAAGEAPLALEQASKNLAAGTYFLSTQINGELHKNFKLLCTGTH